MLRLTVPSAQMNPPASMPALRWRRADRASVCRVDWGRVPASPPFARPSAESAASARPRPPRRRDSSRGRAGQAELVFQPQVRGFAAPPGGLEIGDQGSLHAEDNLRGGRNKDTNRLWNRLRYLCTRVLYRPGGSCEILELLPTAETMQSEKERENVQRQEGY